MESGGAAMRLHTKEELSGLQRGIFAREVFHDLLCFQSLKGKFLQSRVSFAPEQTRLLAACPSFHL